MTRFFIHYFLHLIAPGLISYKYFKNIWIKAWLIMLATMAIDLDHFFATPIYDSCRCSIGFHPLHSSIAIGLYFALLFIPKTRIIAIGLLFHMLTDSIDCFLQSIA